MRSQQAFPRAAAESECMLRRSIWPLFEDEGRVLEVVERKQNKTNTLTEETEKKKKKA